MFSRACERERERQRDRERERERKERAAGAAPRWGAPRRHGPGSSGRTAAVQRRRRLARRARPERPAAPARFDEARGTHQVRDARERLGAAGGSGSAPRRPGSCPQASPGACPSRPLVRVVTVGPRGSCGSWTWRRCGAFAALSSCRTRTDRGPAPGVETASARRRLASGRLSRVGAVAPHRPVTVAVRTDGLLCRSPSGSLEQQQH